jgi:hypothetical protein
LARGRSSRPPKATILQNTDALQSLLVHIRVAAAAARQAIARPKESFMRHAHWIFMFGLLAAAGLSGCNEQQVAQNGTNHTNNTLTVPSGTSIEVTLGTALSSETAGAGTAWSGTVLNGREGIPAGSSVAGTVTSVKPAKKGDRAMLDLGLTAITVAGHRYAVQGSTEAIVAGSTRARNLGAIGAATVAGAVIGHQVGGSDKGTIVGGLIGAGAATGVVSQTKGWQVVLKQGTPLTFTTSQAVAVRI